MENLEKEIIKLLPKNKKNLARWIALKKLDGNKKILENSGGESETLSKKFRKLTAQRRGKNRWEWLGGGGCIPRRDTV